eukprot:1158258-Pelagomonas_calceolata.AAC.2
MHQDMDRAARCLVCVVFLHSSLPANNNERRVHGVPDVARSQLLPAVAQMYCYGPGGSGQSSVMRLTVRRARRFLCNLGIPRRRLRSITIKTSACHVQIAPTPGSDYSIYWQGAPGEGASVVMLVGWGRRSDPVPVFNRERAYSQKCAPANTLGHRWLNPWCLPAYTTHLLLAPISMLSNAHVHREPVPLPTVEEEITMNATTGCSHYDVVISVRSNECLHSSVPGERDSCEDQCAVVSCGAL